MGVEQTAMRGRRGRDVTAPSTIDRRDLVRLRVQRHGLDAEPSSRRDASDVELLDYGVQDTGPDGATWALMARGAPLPTGDELVLAWTLRGAPHAYRRVDLADVAVATAPYSEADAAKRVFDASKPLKAAGIPVLDALRTVADNERAIVTKPTVKGELSSALTDALDEPYLRWCNPCQAIHPYEMPFRLSALQAGLELEVGTSPPVLHRIRGVKPSGFERLAGETDTAHDVIRNHLRFFPGARIKDVAEFVDAPLKDVKAHWPDDAVEIAVTGIDHGPKPSPRYLLEEDLEGGATVDASRRVVLVGNYDPYLQLRDRVLLASDPARWKELWPVIGRPGALLMDGEILASWRPKTAKGALTVNVDPWKRVTAKQRKQIEAEAERLAAFRGVDLAGVAYA